MQGNFFRRIVFISVMVTAPLLGEERADFLVCVHGFMGSPWSMWFLEKDLKKDGWNVVNWGYASREALIQDHGKQLVKELQQLAAKNPNRPIHFVSHSMGGLVLLAALNHPDCPREAKIGRLVAIAPPIRGSIWGQWLNRFSLFRAIAKEFAGKELMTKENFNDMGEYPDSLEKILVIAGSLGFNPFIPGKNDGTLAVTETVLNCPHEHIVIRRGHRMIVFSKKVAELTRNFLSAKLPNDSSSDAHLIKKNSPSTSTLSISSNTKKLIKNSQDLVN